MSPPDRRAENFGRAAGVLGIGFVVGPLIGGLLGALGPRVPFLAAGTLTLLNLLYGLFVLPESLTPDHRRRFSLRTANPIASLASLLRVRRRGSSLVLLSAIIFLVTMAYQVLVSTWVLSNGYRFAWNPREHGISLAVWGTIAAIVQGALIGTLGRWLGDKRLLLLGLVFSVASYLLYGLATAGWMIYAVMLVTALSGTAEPAAQGLVSNEVGDDEQGALHGALGSLAGIAEVVGPLLATTLFSHFTAPGRARAIPGAAFFGGAALVVAASLLAVRTIFGNSQSVPSNEAKHDSSPST